RSAGLVPYTTLFRSVDVLVSEVESTLEERIDVEAAAPPAYRAPSDGSAIDRRPQPAVRLGLNRVRGLPAAAAERIVAARGARSRSEEHTSEVQSREN